MLFVPEEKFDDMGSLISNAVPRTWENSILVP